MRDQNASGSGQAVCSRNTQSGVRGVLQNKEPRFLKAGLSSRKSTIGRPAYLGADESLLVLLDFFDFLWLLFFLWLVVDLAGADAEESDAGGVVSAARTGPAASVNRQTKGTSFLNIDRLH